MKKKHTKIKMPFKKAPAVAASKMSPHSAFSTHTQNGSSDGQDDRETCWCSHWIHTTDKWTVWWNTQPAKVARSAIMSFCRAINASRQAWQKSQDVQRCCSEPPNARAVDGMGRGWWRATRIISISPWDKSEVRFKVKRKNWRTSQQSVKLAWHRSQSPRLWALAWISPT